MNTNFDLSQDAVICKISCGMAGNYAELPDVSEETAKAHGVDPKDIETSVVVLRKCDTQAIQQRVTQARAVHKRFTSPWEDGGRRLLLLANRTMLLSSLNQLKDEIDSIVQEQLLDRYDAIYEDAKRRLNGLFQHIHFPSRDELASKYYMTIDEEPIVSPNDVRLRHVDPKVADEIRKAASALHDTRLKGAQGELIERIDGMLTRVAAIPLERRSKDGKPTKIFETVFSNIKEDIGILESLVTITGNDKLPKVIKAMRDRLADMNIESVRRSTELRALAVNQALDIMDDLDDALGRQKKERPRVQVNDTPAPASDIDVSDIRMPDLVPVKDKPEPASEVDDLLSMEM